MSGHGYINFEWDDNKAAINLRKHGVSFESAALDHVPELGDLVQHFTLGRCYRGCSTM